MRISQPSRATIVRSPTITATLSPVSYAGYPEKKAHPSSKNQPMFELPSNRDSNVAHEMDATPKRSWYKTRGSFI